MNTITVFQSDDGRRFNTEADCRAHEAICGKLNTIMSRLKPKPDGCDFSNGSGYINQGGQLVESVKRELIDLFHDTYPDSPWKSDFTSGINYDRHISHYARFLSDYDSPIYSRGFYRLMCIDTRGREWGQPYFANNPHEGKQVELVEPPTNNAEVE